MWKHTNTVAKAQRDWKCTLTRVTYFRCANLLDLPKVNQFITFSGAGKIPLNISPDLRHFFFSRWFSWWINSRHMWWYLCCWLSLESFCKYAGGGGGGGEGGGETGRQLLHPIFGLRLAASVHKSALQIHFNKYRNTKTNSNKIIKDECRSQTQAQFENLMGSRSLTDFKRSLQNLPLP